MEISQHRASTVVTWARAVRRLWPATAATRSASQPSTRSRLPVTVLRIFKGLHLQSKVGYVGAHLPRSGSGMRAAGPHVETGARYLDRSLPATAPLTRGFGLLFPSDAGFLVPLAPLHFRQDASFLDFLLEALERALDRLVFSEANFRQYFHPPS